MLKTISWMIGLLCLVTTTCFASVTATVSRGEVYLTWTNLATTNCSTNPSAYNIKEYVNGNLERQWFITLPSTQSKTIDIPRVVQSDTAYGYVVYYYKCSGSGGTYLVAGSTTDVVKAPPIEDRRVIFIHTDLLGSPAAESNERGENTNE